MIHIAGTPVAIGSLHRQRCCWCGETLIDDDLSNMVVDDAGARHPSAFAVGALVRKEGNRRAGFMATVGQPEDGPIAWNDLQAGWCGQPANVVALPKRGGGR